MVPEDELDESSTSEEEQENTEVEDIEKIKHSLAEEKVKAESYLANWQRCQADLTNYKRRAELEKEEAVKFANSAIVCNILPILDDFERAFAALSGEQAEQSWLDGIKLVERKLFSCLELQGLTQIKALGEPFDPRFHEAIKQDKGKEDIVVAEVQKGYKFRDRVIRPTKVIVGNGEDEEAAPAQERA